MYGSFWLNFPVSMIHSLSALSVREVGDTLLTAAYEAYLSCSPPNTCHRLLSHWGQVAAELGVPTSSTHLRFHTILPTPQALLPHLAYIAHLTDMHGSGDDSARKSASTTEKREESATSTSIKDSKTEPQLDSVICHGLSSVNCVLLMFWQVHHHIPFLMDPEGEALPYIQAAFGNSGLNSVEVTYSPYIFEVYFTNARFF